jgi:hypothetical protein
MCWRSQTSPWTHHSAQERYRPGQRPWDPRPATWTPPGTRTSATSPSRPASRAPMPAATQTHRRSDFTIFDNNTLEYLVQCFGPGFALDPHATGFMYLDPIPHSACGSGSRRVKSTKIERQNGAKRQKIHHEKS